MALIKPEFEELQDKVYTQMSGKLCPEDSFLRGGLLRVLSNVMAYLTWSNYQFACNQGRTPWDATGEFLLAWGRTCGIEPFDETCAEGFVDVTGNGIVPNGAILSRCDGIQYQVQGETIIPGQVFVTALTCGADSNTPNGAVLTFSGAYPGVSNVGTVDLNSIAGGANAETEDQFRQRVIACLANPCRTGLESDYDFWARLYPGVTRVCVQSKPNGPGTVKVAFAMDDIYTDGIPAQSDVEAVQDIMDAEAPLGVCVSTCAVTPVVVDMTIALEFSTQAERQLIKEALEEAFKNSGCDGFCLGDLFRVISDVYPRCFQIIAPLDGVTIPFGSIPVLGTISYVGL